METISCLVSYESPSNSGPNAKKTGVIAYILPFTPTYLLLGFTVDLFRLFQTCEPASCPPYRMIRIQSDLDLHPRLISPTLSRLLKDHLGCHQGYRSDFGALLQSTSDNSYTSHWDPIFLQGSIMTPAIDKMAYLSLLDPFTLAVLQDTGWYSVNLSNADPYLWGKGKGCDFGLYTDPELTCIVKEPGCHYLHLDKSVCSEIPGAGNLQVRLCCRRIYLELASLLKRRRGLVHTEKNIAGGLIASIRSVFVVLPVC